MTSGRQWLWTVAFLAIVLLGALALVPEIITEWPGR